MNEQMLSREFFDIASKQVLVRIAINPLIGDLNRHYYNKTYMQNALEIRVELYVIAAGRPFQSDNPSPLMLCKLRYDGAYPPPLIHTDMEVKILGKFSDDGAGKNSLLSELEKIMHAWTYEDLEHGTTMGLHPKWGETGQVVIERWWPEKLSQEIGAAYFPLIPIYCQIQDRLSNFSCGEPTLGMQERIDVQFVLSRRFFSFYCEQLRIHDNVNGFPPIVEKTD